MVVPFAPHRPEETECMTPEEKFKEELESTTKEWIRRCVIVLSLYIITLAIALGGIQIKN
jgi:hypothetical protein